MWSELTDPLDVHFLLHTTMKPTLSVQVLIEMIAGATLLTLNGDIVSSHVVSLDTITKT